MSGDSEDVRAEYIRAARGAGPVRMEPQPPWREAESIDAMSVEYHEAVVRDMQAQSTARRRADARHLAELLESWAARAESEGDDKRARQLRLCAGMVMEL